LPVWLSANVFRVPFLLIYLVGVVLSLALWRRQPRRALFSLIAFLLFLFGNLVGMVGMWWIVTGPPGAGGRFGIEFALLNLATAACQIAAWVFLMVALFARLENERFAPRLARHPESEDWPPPGQGSQDVFRPNERQ
jgi:hypothetical protein